ncbi:MAG TPA: NfeD family protein [Baekduia sp.]|uniref:NfeD family protein n=1 Tax=Baekduia sp. TaxID=2600305 RepID=UPI002B959514|nr:NfeD family protein [Baekduia sp.]HMJ37162.1 NfeD family protein [Baekduia sp.]
MDAWLVWLIAGVFAAVGEILTAGFFLAPFAVGAFAALLAALVGAGDLVQLLTFAAVTIACFGLVRPIAKRHMYQPPQIRTGTAALVGRPAMVLERISNDDNVGSVRIDGEVWTARAYDEDRVIDVGTKVQVVEIRGATALVEP